MSDEPPIYRQVLGPDFGGLPPMVQALHDTTDRRRWQGQASVTRGRSLPARLIGWLIGLPPAAPSVPVTVEMAYEGNTETWLRDFGGHRFRSRLSPGTGRDLGFMTERFGPAAFTLQFRIDGARLYLIPVRWRLFGLPMPRFLCPGGDSFETEQGGQYHFDVTLQAPLAGLIVTYRGWLRPSGQAEP